MWSAWSAPGVAAPMLALAALVYLRGWRRLRRVEPWRWNGLRPACWLAGLGVIALALHSPLDTLGAWLLSAHMTQHLLLSMVAPPLLLCAWPFQPMMAGLPRWASRDLLGPLLAWPAAQGALRRLVHPPVAWGLSVAATWIWHFPFAYEWALRSDAAHGFEHACFLWTGVLFWWPVVEPWPWKGRWPRWSMAFYLLAADVANTLVAAVLAFAPAAVYAPYRDTAPALGIDALADQQRAAAIMWLPGSLVMLVPAVVIVVRALSPRRARRALALPVLRQGPPRRERWDALRTPVIGALLRHPRARLALRFAVLALAAVVMLDGWRGPDAAATNVAGTWPWTHWRGLAAVSVVAFGNLACMGCPLIAPRTLLRRWIRPTRRWPAKLRAKWLVAGVIVSWLIAYEALGWWDSPWLTAWLVVGLLVAATAVDLLFEGAAFCQWMCPIGQWNVAMSVASPVQVGVRDASVCARCTTHDCLRGGPSGPGCGTGIFLPRKVGSLECTACLDCVTACPHGNVGLLAVAPFAEARDEGPRAAVGRWTDRLDLAALLLVLASGAIANALLMTEPAAQLVQAWFEGWPAVPARALVTATVIAALCVPALTAACLGSSEGPLRTRLARLATDLWPLGVAMWLVHFGFHLATGWRSAWPPLQRAAREAGVADLGDPQWLANCCAAQPAWLVPVMLLALGAGLLVSLQLLWSRAGRRGRRFMPGACAALAWWATSAWIVLQPMQMRGLLP